MTDSVEAGALEKLRSSDWTESGADCAEPSAPRGFCEHLTLEPALAGAMMAIFLAQTSLQNFYLRTACSMDLRFPAGVCDRGVGPEFREAEISSQQLVSQINVSRGFVGALISTCVLLFLGPWSDCSRRRKPLLVVSLLGMCVATFNVLVMLTFPIFSSVWVLYLVQIPMSLGGNFGLLLAAGFSYIGDVCHESGKNVTMTMGKHRAAVQCASVFGALAGPMIYRYLGFYGVFPIVFSLQVSALVWVVWRVRDLRVNTENRVSVLDARLPAAAARPAPLEASVARVSALVWVVWRVRDVRVNTENRVSVLDVRLPAAAVRCLLSPRLHHRRKIVLLMMLVALADRTILASEVLLWYMYARNKYQWDDMIFGGYLAYRNIISFFGTLLILRLFKARLRLSDELVGAISGVSLAVATACLIAARSTLAVFFVPLVAIIAQGSQVVQRPIINKQIETTEQGKIYSVVGALEQACQTAISPLFSLLYSRTVEHAPDAWLAPCLLMGLVQVGSFLFARSYVREQDAATAEKSPPKESDPNVHNHIGTTLKEIKPADGSLGDFKNNIADDMTYEELNRNINVISASHEKRIHSEMTESTEHLKTELDEELKSVLKAVDDSVFRKNNDVDLHNE